MLLDSLLKARVKVGRLRLKLPDGTIKTYGDTGPEVCWQITDKAALRKIATDPEFMLGQTYMDGQWQVSDGNLIGLLEILLRNFPEANKNIWQNVGEKILQPWRLWNRETVARRNIAHHYDLPPDLFRRFLDREMHYSCAYFSQSPMSLEAAQAAKCELIRRKLCLKPGQRVLDIGCGWGSMARYLAKHSGVEVVGLTLSREQKTLADSLNREAGLSQQIEIRLQDYRHCKETFDRIVSIGMFEHVGPQYYNSYFERLQQCLAPNGIALLHTIGRAVPWAGSNPWINRYIFPGGYIPSLSEVSRAIEKQGLYTTDVEVLRIHYANTLAAWQSRFQQERSMFAEQMGERFCRMWEFYLAVCEGAFRWRHLQVFHLQLAKMLDAVPTTRDYLYQQPVVGYRQPAPQPSRSPTGAEAP